MRCPACATELIHPANFCPVCGTPLELPGTPLTPAMPPAAGNEPPHAILPPIHAAPEPGEASDAADADNVVFLHQHGEGPNAPGIPPNPHAADYGTGSAPPAGLVPGPGAGQSTPGPRPEAGRQTHAEPVASGAPARPVTQLPSQADTAASFFDDGDPAFWRDDVDQEPRVLGAALAIGALLSALVGFAWYGNALRTGSGGAEAGGFVLISALLWIFYLSLRPEQQHESLLALHARVRGFVDSRIDPLQHRTRARLVLRHERDRYRSMRDERIRRVTELGELSYRVFRAGGLDPQLQRQAQRVMAIEQQMLMQDQRLERLHEERRKPRRTSD